MNANRYRPRIVDAELERRLRSSGAVVIEGPKACGKTVTGRRRAESEVYLDTDPDPDARKLVHLDPRLLLAGPSPRLLDAWQVEPALSTLARDVGGADGAWSRDTVRGYLGALERLMVVEDQRAWGPHLRSRSRVRQSPKRHFVDPSIAAAALGATASRLLGDHNLLGLLFESLVVRDLRIYAQASGGDVLHYRDETGLEVDAIVELHDGRWAAFEVKLGTVAVDSAAKCLLRLAERVDTERCGPPAALGVITGMGYGYQRPDGVNVIPIGALGS